MESLGFPSGTIASSNGPIISYAWKAIQFFCLQLHEFSQSYPKEALATCTMMFVN